jgi:hypothetical protein
MVITMLAVAATGTVLSAFLVPVGTEPGVGGAERRAQREACVLLVALECYQADYGTFPVGGDAVVCRELAGGAQTKAYCEWPGAMAAEGSFLDPWGTPYHFRNVGEQVIVRSAGRDRKFADDGLGDDVVVSN